MHEAIGPSVQFGMTTFKATIPACGTTFPCATRSDTVLTTRRTILISISHLASSAILVALTGTADEASANASTPDLELLARVAYDILPYAELAPELYISAAQQILDLNDKDVAVGLQRLRDISHKATWHDVSQTDQVAILSSLQNTPFFRLIRATTLRVLLREPATFAIVGYGGPSIQYGGYINRGFNNISWLPASDRK